MKRFAEFSFPIAILAILVIYTYALFAELPYLGFYISYLDEITEVYVPGTPLKEGARLLELNGTSWHARKQQIYRPLFQGVEPGDTLQLTVLQDGVVQDIDWTIPENRTAEMAARLNGLWWRPFVFWLAGTVIWFVLRPRNLTWRVLVYFQMLIALYLAVLSGPTQGNLLWSVPFSRLLGCMSLPLFFHLHWRFPHPIAEAPRWLPGVLYSLCLAVGIAAAADLFSFDIPYWFAVLAVLSSILLLVGKTIFQKESRVENSFLLIMFTVIFLPGLFATLSYSLINVRLDYFTLTGAYLGLPALPGVYFLVSLSLLPYVSPRRVRRTRRLYIVLVVLCSVVFTGIYSFFDVGAGATVLQTLGFVQISIAVLSSAVAVFPLLSAVGLAAYGSSPGVSVSAELKPRANRLVIPYLFAVFTSVLLIAFFVSAVDRLFLRMREVQIGLFTGILMTVLTLVSYPKFSRSFERYVFGVVEDTGALIETYARRITTTLTLSDLSTVHVTQLLPTMLVRQAGLLYLDLHGQISWLYARGILADEQPKLEDLLPYLGPEANGGQVFFRSEEPVPADWIRVMFPLRISGKLIGVWLLGERDPDDEYTISDLAVLQAISNQTAIALSNILLTSQLQELYQANIDKEEEDRSEIARGLHDLVLNQLASLAMQITDQADQDELMATYHRVTSSLRELIVRLRTVVLEFGLSHAIHEMASQLMDENPTAQIDVQLAHHSPRYDSKVERHIYFIIQQVCTNALQHSGATKIMIRGRLEEQVIDIEVTDNGTGFSASELDLSRLIEQRRFGMVGIYERAELIQAALAVNSEPGNGTRVILHWESQDDA